MRITHTIKCFRFIARSRCVLHCDLYLIIVLRLTLFSSACSTFFNLGLSLTDYLSLIFFPFHAIHFNTSSLDLFYAFISFSQGIVYFNFSDLVHLFSVVCVAIS